ncbi:hypothetical protein BKA80DRAFT_305016 [Phyllosticta citrichinensis]
MTLNEIDQGACEAGTAAERKAEKPRCLVCKAEKAARMKEHVSKILKLTEPPVAAAIRQVGTTRVWAAPGGTGSTANEECVGAWTWFERRGTEEFQDAMDEARVGGKYGWGLVDGGERRTAAKLMHDGREEIFRGQPGWRRQDAHGKEKKSESTDLDSHARHLDSADANPHTAGGLPDTVFDRRRADGFASHAGSSTRRRVFAAFAPLFQHPQHATSRAIYGPMISIVAEAVVSVEIITILSSCPNSAIGNDSQFAARPNANSTVIAYG